MTKLNAHEAKCLENAVEFTAVRGRAGTRTCSRFATLAEAQAHAKKFADGRTMIYAVTADALAAHIMNA